MRARLGVIASAVLAAALAVVAVPGAAAAAVDKARPGGGFVPAGNVRTAGMTSNGPAVTSVATGVPQSFCYVFVDTVFPDSSFTTYKVEWELDCRSRAVPTAPAPDLTSIVMNVSIRTGNPYNAYQEIKRVRCFPRDPGLTTKLRCPAEVPMQPGVPYFTQLEAEVYLLDAPTQYGTFFTLPTIST